MVVALLSANRLKLTMMASQDTNTTRKGTGITLPCLGEWSKRVLAQIFGGGYGPGFERAWASFCGDSFNIASYNDKLAALAWDRLIPHRIGTVLAPNPAGQGGSCAPAAGSSRRLVSGPYSAKMRSSTTMLAVSCWT